MDKRSRPGDAPSLHSPLSRRRFLKNVGLLGGTVALGHMLQGPARRALASPAEAPRPVLTGEEIHLKIARTQVVVDGQRGWATTVNGRLPGPEIRLREGQDIRLLVTNTLSEQSSIHWHGLLVPPGMDGVPGVNFPGISPGETFEYQFPIRQSGTYWYHSHSGFQEQTGLMGSIVIEPAGEEPHPSDRQYTLVLSDWTFEDPHRIYCRLKSYEGYYNFQRRTLSNLPVEAAKSGLGAALRDRMRWARMRMDSTDLADVTAATYTYLMNGRSPSEDWRGLFVPGERIRLRIINASAATYFDVRIPGLSMTVVQADGMNVQPVEVDELRVAVAETFDVLIEPTGAAYRIFAETSDRSGFAAGTLATGPERMAPLPERRPRPLLTMDDMGMDMDGMDMDGMDMAGMDHGATDHSTMDHSTMDHSTMGHGSQMGAGLAPACAEPLSIVSRHDDDRHGPGNAMIAQVARPRVDDPGVGLRDAPWRVLTYSDLRRAQPPASSPPPQREIVLHLTGNMERYMWSFDGEAYRADMAPIALKQGERVRWVLINDTMMAHPIHLHGMFFELEVGACEQNPLKHTVNVKPAERVSFTLTATEVGRWPLHCHILYHMDAGMFRVVEVHP